ncbi:hypothetical protein [Thermococcus sp. Bubb.Bath]|uniref:hypothetical protein n=1 Tax=Thermococcus sp. Bubb.Bath TaxID=1638242 RepID=UPI00143AD884|nr:hypothetical protein [Thermococcus sp. Bubb.Bath]NJF25505.1 hypothetical protein [Thermococcus sp. Bubb.Bath]
MKYLVLLSLAFIFLLIGGWAYHIHAENEKLKDPEFIYEHYLKPYETENYTLLGVYFELDQGSMIASWKPKWEFYLYHPTGKIVKLTIIPKGMSKEELKTILSYTSLTAPVNQVKNLPKYEEGFRERVYLPGEGKLIAYSPSDYEKFRKVCVSMGKILDNGTFKLIRTVHGVNAVGSHEWLTLENTSPVNGIMALTTSNDPLCEGTWMVIEPYNETHDLVKVIYPHGNASALVRALDLPLFQGNEYSKLLKKVDESPCVDVEGTLVNATGIYVNPHAQEIFNQLVQKALQEKQCFKVIQVTVLKNGTVRTWARGTIWCARRH